MQKIVKLVAIVGVTASIAACAGRTTAGDDVVFVPNPVTPDPVSTKY